MTAAVTFKVVDAGSRRIVATSPVSRPDLRLPRAHPRRVGSAGVVAGVSSCAVARPLRSSRWVAVKLAVVGVLAVAGGVVSLAQFAADAAPEAPSGYVAGDPAWSHVSQP